MTSVNKAYC